MWQMFLIGIAIVQGLSIIRKLYYVWLRQPAVQLAITMISIKGPAINVQAHAQNACSPLLHAQRA